MPGRGGGSESNYRFGYQGQFAEKDYETGYSQFEARLYDARIGRWMVPDPAGQFWSPYVGMGNDWVNGVDPDGKYKWKIMAELANFLFGGNGVGYDKVKGEYYFSKGFGQGVNNCVKPIYSSPFYISGRLRIDKGPQGGIGLNVLGIKFAAFAQYETKPFGDAGFEWTPGAEKGERYTSHWYPEGKWPSDVSQTSADVGIGAIGGGWEFEPKRSGKLFDVGPVKSQSISIPVLGTKTVEFLNPHGQSGIVSAERHSWGLDFKAGAIAVGLKAKIEFGFKIINN